MASKRRLRRKECSRKQQYSSRESAEIIARKVQVANSQRRVTGESFGLTGIVRAYKCDWGNHWHVGHLNQKQKAALRHHIGRTYGPQVDAEERSTE